MKKLKRGIIALLAVGFVLGTVSGVSAHEHILKTPGGNQVIIKEEPFHGTDPTNGKNPNLSVDRATGELILHPIHEKLHTGPSVGKRAIQVCVNADGEPVPGTCQ
ncbi:hypothetical protein J2S74_003754 [Evansella vedderi]|uniref:Uncharacterized protein n=1 Tax=Evansella vedderi TaxID=38282 RepID=A0ABT9ZYL6_9BACI|nr:hypothetical protein [Evansella vedderi]MDQ0256334.1 hypothetical protein [Evansella vedderi]